MNKISFASGGLLGVLVLGLAGVSGCSQDKNDPGWEYAPNMYEAVPYEADKPNPNYADGKTMQRAPEGAIKQGWMPFHYANTPEDYERAGVELKSPLDKTAENLEQGKWVYTNYCVYCHGPEGKGDGNLAKEGKFPPPPAYQTDNLKNLPEGKIYFSITYGKNLMGAHASQLSPEQRWQVVQYVQHLQKLNTETASNR